MKQLEAADLLTDEEREWCSGPPFGEVYGVVRLLASRLSEARQERDEARERYISRVNRDVARENRNLEGAAFRLADDRADSRLLVAARARIAELEVALNTARLVPGICTAPSDDVLYEWAEEHNKRIDEALGLERAIEAKRSAEPK